MLRLRSLGSIVSRSMSLRRSPNLAFSHESFDPEAHGLCRASGPIVVGLDVSLDPFHTQLVDRISADQLYRANCDALLREVREDPIGDLRHTIRTQAEFHSASQVRFGEETGRECSDWAAGRPVLAPSGDRCTH